MRDIEAFAPGGAPALKYAAARPSRLIDNRRVQNSLSKYLYSECNGGACLREALAVDLPPRRHRAVVSRAYKRTRRVLTRALYSSYRTLARISHASSARENAREGNRESISYAQIPPGKSDLSLVNGVIRPTIFFSRMDRDARSFAARSKSTDCSSLVRSRCDATRTNRVFTRALSRKTSRRGRGV